MLQVSRASARQMKCKTHHAFIISDSTARVARRFPFDLIPQRASETFPLNHDLVALVQNHTIAETGHAASQKMDMHIARNPVGLKLKMMLLNLLQPERSVFLAGPDFFGPNRRPASALWSPIRPRPGTPASSANSGPMEQFRQLGPREQSSILHRHDGIREFVAGSQANASRNAVRPDQVNRG